MYSGGLLDIAHVQYINREMTRGRKVAGNGRSRNDRGVLKYSFFYQAEDGIRDWP